MDNGITPQVFLQVPTISSATKMYQHNLKVKINSYLQNFTKRQIPKFVSIFFLTLLFVFGYDFGFTNVISKKYRSYLKLLGTIVFILTVVLLIIPAFYYLDSATLGFFHVTCLQYTIHGFLLYITKYNVHDFITEIYKIHNKIYDKEFIFLSCVLAYNLITWILKMLVCFTQCALSGDSSTSCIDIISIVPLYFYCITFPALDLVAVAQIVIYYYIYASLKFLRQLMEKKCIDLSNARHQFVMIEDCCDKISALYENLVSTVDG